MAWWRSRELEWIQGSQVAEAGELEEGEEAEAGEDLETETLVNAMTLF